MRTLRDRWLELDLQADQDLAAMVAEAARPLRHGADLEPLVRRAADARVVLLGEATHGTSEFYVWRASLTRRLIEEQGFSFVAVEGDWPDCYLVNRFVKCYNGSGDSAVEVLHAFNRWPTWMWANWELAAFTEWLRRHNGNLAPDERCGFYGLDVYSLWDSLRAVIRYLDRVDGTAAEAARRAFRCFEPYGEDAQEYASSLLSFPSSSCKDEAVALLSAMRSGVEAASPADREAAFVADQNALVVKNAEEYYRTMVRADSLSWNVRDRHMTGTLERLLQFHGPESRGIVWEHNTHVGDARATDMAAVGMVNVGQLAREVFGRDSALLVGFGTFCGTVIAADAWDSPMQRMELPDARGGSWEAIHHLASGEDKLTLLPREGLASLWREPRGHRAVGVVYDPAREYRGNYVPTILPERYDAFISLERTHALHPLHVTPTAHLEMPETYPWGF